MQVLRQRMSESQFFGWNLPDLLTLQQNKNRIGMTSVHESFLCFIFKLAVCSPWNLSSVCAWFPQKSSSAIKFYISETRGGSRFRKKLSDSREGWTVSFTLKFYCTADQYYHEIRRLNIFNSENASLHLKFGNLPSTNPSESWFNINFSLCFHYKKDFSKSCSHKSTSNWSTDFSANCFKHSEPSADFISSF